jgi:hypothetical protein
MSFKPFVKSGLNNSRPLIFIDIDEALSQVFWQALVDTVSPIRYDRSNDSRNVLARYGRRLTTRVQASLLSCFNEKRSRIEP